MKPTFTLRTGSISIGIHWTLLTLIGWILIIDGLSGKTPMHTLWTLLALAGIFASVILHELGHMLMARHFGIPVTDIVLLPIGGAIKLKRQPVNPRQEILISLSGPVVSLLIGLIMIPFLPDARPIWKAIPLFMRSGGVNFLFLMHAVNLLIALINMIPAFPMDGGRILRGMLEIFTEPMKATSIAIWVGRIVALLFIVSGMLNMNVLLIATGIFLLLQGTFEKRDALIRAGLSGIALRDMLVHDYRVIPAGMSLREALVPLTDYRQPYFVIVDGSRPVGVISRVTMLNHIDRRNIDRAVIDLLEESHSALDISLSAVAAWDELPAETDLIVPVTSNGELTGVISRDAVLEYLMLHEQGAALEEVYG